MQLSGSPLDYILVFVGGVAVSLTPCVFPLIPITAGFIGIQAGASKLRGLGLSFTYVTGIAVTYSALGLIASLTGTFFGRFTQNPITYLVVGVIVFLFGLAMLGVFTVSMPIVTRLPRVKKGSFISAFVLGLSSGLIIGPCITPVLGAILAYLATKKNILYGTTLLFTFAYGMGLLLMVVGTFSGILVNFPALGKKMVYIKKICAVILMAVGVYIIASAIRRL
ncbi:MAG: sulfite exporter TauE/SafE family protein [Candidatus Omnitrophica bacterium]|nr:sulfite exporter TauE/SafE family protein [Candidatus Omnitrophota bacterium]